MKHDFANAISNFANNLQDLGFARKDSQNISKDFFIDIAIPSNNNSPQVKAT